MGNCSCLEFFQAKASKAPAGASESKDDDPTAMVEAIFDGMRDAIAGIDRHLEMTANI